MGNIGITVETLDQPEGFAADAPPGEKGVPWTGIARAVAAALILFVFGGAAASAEEPVRIDLTPAQWQEDIRVFGQEMARRHRSAFHLTTQPRFEREVADLIARAPKLEDYEVVQGLNALTASVGDGHTFLAVSSTYHRYPIGLFWFGDELRVIRASEQYRNLLGARIISVEGRPIADVQRALQRYIPQGENQWYVLEHSGEVLVTPESMAALGITPRLGPARIAFESAEGWRFTTQLPALAPGAQITWAQADQISPYLRRRDDGLWFTYLPETRTVYADFRSYRQLEQNAKTLWAFIDANDVDRLIIDLRHNPGGNYSEGRRLLLYPAIFKPRLNRWGHLYVLTGRATFSAAMTNATDFHRETEAILVGAPTSGRPNGFQENGWFYLPNSHIGVSAAQLHYRFGDEGADAVYPDQRIDPDFASYWAGRDPVMEWVLQQPLTQTSVSRE